jgi:chromate transporter
LWSISLGYLTYGWLGSLLALAALSLPPLLIVGVAAFYKRIENVPVVQDFTRGLALGVVGLTLAVAFAIAHSTIVDWRGIAVAIGALVIALSKRVPVLAVLCLAGLAGIAFYAW